MDDPNRTRTLVEMPEYTAQFDFLVAKYSDNVIEPVLRGLLWGIATLPQSFGRAMWDVRVAKNRSLGLTIPIFRIYFQIADENTENERVLLCWIEETGSVEDLTE